MSIKTSAIQYENDDIMRPEYGDDYGIACCVSAMRIGKQMQFFGARANLAKHYYMRLTVAKMKSQKHKLVQYAPITSEVLNYEEVMHKFDMTMEWLAGLYLNTLNVIHTCMINIAIEMALHDTNVLRTMATGIAGLSVVADSLSAIKYAKVKPIRDENGIAVDFEIEGDFPKYGNNDDRVDEIAVNLVKHL